ncbi:hypothetical protein HBH64_136480 [Parastagonospora nodorum]|nr:hypothetical protein HBH53_007220 [Parastagonospora nodorum]KAH4069280.1 hypothetical protein HBH50_111150 [Parastagonospora nodorum]KAH4088350.1 hypothetical protein HBH48_128120 [Parastagonospora nodorum]KAH4317434.1 hypothetical protein HBI02_025510 [Parastagonospora nodorum]KAH4477564.1 hypothetical protein HBH90_010620 [Parastagonospora nodorum]
MFGLSRGDTVVLPAIAAVVSDIVRDFLSLASALEHQEVSTTQVTDSSIKDELTRFKVIQNILSIWHRLTDRAKVADSAMPLTSRVTYTICLELCPKQYKTLSCEANEFRGTPMNSPALDPNPNHLKMISRIVPNYISSFRAPKSRFMKDMTRFMFKKSTQTALCISQSGWGEEFQVAGSISAIERNTDSTC